MTLPPQILVAELSPLYRGMFSRAAELETCASVAFVYGLDEVFEIIGRANFDVIVIDSAVAGKELPRCLSAIGRELPNAAVLVTTQPSKGNEALKKQISQSGGAQCFVKPIYGSYDENLGEIRRMLADMIALSRKDKRPGEPADSESGAKGRSHERGLVLVAASTGGQQAMEAILPKIAGDFPAPVLVALHMPAFSTENVASSLNGKAALKVKVARDSERVKPGVVYLAPGGLHMTVSAHKHILLVDSPPVNGVKPSADTLFESVAKAGAWDEVLAVILTGMGRDGAKGLAALKAKLNCRCIAQSERTCVVYGMPKAAVESGLADKILDLGDIARGVRAFGFSPLT